MNKEISIRNNYVNDDDNEANRVLHFRLCKWIEYGSNPRFDTL